MPEKRHRPQDLGPAGGVERVYRGAFRACQTVNAAMWQNFFSPEKCRKSGPSDHNRAAILGCAPLAVDLAQERQGKRPIAAYGWENARHKQVKTRAAVPPKDLESGHRD